MAGFGLIRRFAKASVALLGGFFAFATPAHALAPQRIAAVDNASRVTLTGAVSPRARAASDLGPAAGERQLAMSLRFAMTSEQQASLTRLLNDQQNPGSSVYHRWLTPEQFGTQFGLTPSDLAKVSAWLASQGFTVRSVGRGGMFVRFTGSVAQANQAFHTQIERVSLSGEEHIANLTAPTLPAAIAKVTQSITGLHDFSLMAPHALKPRYTTAGGAHYLAPGDLYTMYDVNGLLSSNVNGNGVTLVVVGQQDVTISDVTAFRAAAGLTVNDPTVTLYGADPGSGSAADAEESTLDLEWAGAMAPSAKVLFVNATDVINGSITEAIDNNLGPVISNSYGACEASIGVTDLNYYNSLLQQGAAEGITIISPAGDSGATDCDYHLASAVGGLAVDFPASSSYVTGVGGTELSEGSGNYWNTTNTSGGASAKSYIPEIVWNDSGSGTIAGSGGGASLVFPKPSWQIGSGVPVDASRDVPDVAMPGSGNHDPYLFCYSGSCANGFLTKTGSVATVGGTSVAAPVFAGLITLVVQKQGRIGVANDTLYALANSTYATNVFHDITSGTNASPCTTGTTDCPIGGTIGFSAGTGYDQATGWGSVDAMNMVTDWALVTPFSSTPAGLTPTLTNLGSSASTVAAGTSVTLTAVTASATTSSSTAPTGTFTFTVDSVVVGTAAVNGTGTGTLVLNTSTLSVGTHKLQATYSGDGTYYGSKGAFVLTITSSMSTAPDFTLTPANVTLGATSGTFAQAISYTVAPRNGFTGTVKFDAVYSATANITKIFSSSSVTITGTSPATTTLTLAAYTGGDLSSIDAYRFNWQKTGTDLVLASLLVLLMPMRRRKLPALCVALLGTVAFVTMSGCASNTSNSSPAATSTKNNAAAGTYSISVTATSTVNGTAVTHTSNVKLTVQ